MMTEYTVSDFNVKKLGSFYFPDKTVFRVFAPDHAELELVIAGHPYQMHRSGLYFEIALGGDLEGVRYHYRTSKGLCFRDPFAYVSIGEDSVVVNREKFETEKILLPEMKDVIIYEANVRDFSSSPSWNGTLRSKFLSLKEEGLKKDGTYPIGLDYLKDLGITHLQLMPVLDYDNDHSSYNWGYNPMAYNCVKADYVLDQDDPYAYVNEFRQTVNALHKNGIRVVLDVVFNHVYDPKNCDLEKMLPGHIFRYRPDGTLAEGTLCGNEVKTEDPFVREYLCEMVLRYLNLFDIDGLRLDLMGICDLDTVNRIYQTARIYKKDFIVYGEGWNMGDVLAEGRRGTIQNRLMMPGIGMFNDYFRGVMTHYISGNDGIMKKVESALMGSPEYLGASQSINYVECHDGLTLFDHLCRYKADDDLTVNIRRCKLALGLVTVARGIPFFHMGQEFLRTKLGVENSYNSGDLINGIDWDLRVANSAICDYFRDLISVRKQYGEFRDENVEITFENRDNCLVYQIGALTVLINPGDIDFLYQDGKTYEIILNNSGRCNIFSDSVTVESHSLVICKG